ncbi:hypothetical protein F4777DRAFT_114476 [Nemania sp. FL0916]|nr:hypothetical protein F4777DRAFT_114476 [Nemania sp. FL0916]
MKTWQEGTCTWFLKEPLVVEWITGVTIRTLWCRGSRGAGKTVLMATVFEYLKAQKIKDAAIIQIYLANRDQKQQTASNLLPAILRQLSEQSPDLSLIIKECYKNNSSTGNKPPQKQYPLMIQSEAERFRKVYILIDGLDECSDQTRLDLLNLVNHLLESHTGTYLLVSSRRVDSVGANLKDAAEIEIQARPEDTEHYVDECFKKMAGLQKIVQKFPELATKIKSELISKASGLFLLPKLHLQLLDSSGKRTKSGLLRFLESLPPLIDETYKEVWDEIMSQRSEEAMLAKSVLTWVSYARQPLHIRALQHALFTEKTAAPNKAWCIDEDDLEYPDDIIQVCNGLIVRHRESDIVRFDHYTAEVFFSEYLANKIPAAHSTITKTCIQYITMIASEDVTDDGERVYSYDLYPLLHYAVTSWGYHAKTEESNQHVASDIVLSFLEDNKLVNLAAGLLDMELLTRSGINFGYRSYVAGIHLAAFFGLDHTLDQLLSGETSMLDIVDSIGWSALRWACYGGEKCTVENLIKRGANVDIKDTRGDTTLTWALWSRPTNLNFGNATIVAKRRRTLGSSAGVYSTGMLKGLSLYCQPSTTSIQLFHNGAVQIFSPRGSFIQLSHGVLLGPGDSQVTISQESPMPLATSTEIISILIDHSDTLNNCDGPDGRTALCRAAENQQLDIVEKLLKKGVDIESRDRDHITPLLCVLQSPRITCRFGSVRIRGPIFVHMGSTVIVSSPSAEQDCMNSSPLAQTSRQETIALQLIGNRVNAVDINGRTPLSLAAESGYIELVDALIQKDADVNLADMKGITPLMYASMPFQLLRNSYGNLDIADNAIACIGAAMHVQGDVNSINMWDDDNFVNRRVAIIKSILKAGADTERRSSIHGFTAYQYAFHSGWPRPERILSLLPKSVQREGLELTPWGFHIVSSAGIRKVEQPTTEFVGAEKFIQRWNHQQITCEVVQVDNSHILAGQVWTRTKREDLFKSINLQWFEITKSWGLWYGDSIFV